MKAKDLMTSDQIWSCIESTTAAEAARMLAEHNIGSVPVMDNLGRLSGIVTDRDICCKVFAAGQAPTTPVSEFMSRPVQMAHPETDVAEVERLMRQYRIRRLPIVDEERRLVGYISLADMARKIHGLMKERQLVETLAGISAP